MPKYYITTLCPYCDIAAYHSFESWGDWLKCPHCNLHFVARTSTMKRKHERICLNCPNCLNNAVYDFDYWSESIRCMHCESLFIASEGIIKNNMNKPIQDPTKYYCKITSIYDLCGLLNVATISGYKCVQRHASQLDVNKYFYYCPVAKQWQIVTTINKSGRTEVDSAQELMKCILNKPFKVKEIEPEWEIGCVKVQWDKNRDCLVLRDPSGEILVPLDVIILIAKRGKELGYNI